MRQSSVTIANGALIKTMGSDTNGKVGLRVVIEPKSSYLIDDINTVKELNQTFNQGLVHN